MLLSFFSEYHYCDVTVYFWLSLLCMPTAKTGCHFCSWIGSFRHFGANPRQWFCFRNWTRKQAMYWFYECFSTNELKLFSGWPNRCLGYNNNTAFNLTVGKCCYNYGDNSMHDCPQEIGADNTTWGFNSLLRHTPYKSRFTSIGQCQNTREGQPLQGVTMSWPHTWLVEGTAPTMMLSIMFFILMTVLSARPTVTLPEGAPSLDMQASVISKLNKLLLEYFYHMNTFVVLETCIIFGVTRPMWLQYVCKTKTLADIQTIYISPRNIMISKQYDLGKLWPQNIMTSKRRDLKTLRPQNM